MRARRRQYASHGRWCRGLTQTYVCDTFTEGHQRVVMGPAERGIDA